MRTKVRTTTATLNFLNIKSVLAFSRKGEEKNMSGNPGDMFRPCPAPEITDHEEEITFPTILNRFLVFDNRVHIVEYDWDKQADVSYTYREWFRHRRQTIYAGDYPYPWTRLGYTYDRGNTSNRVGLSEFVILGSSTAGINSIISNDDYF